MYTPCQMRLLLVGTARRGPTGSSCDVELHVALLHGILPQGRPRDSRLADLVGKVVCMLM